MTIISKLVLAVALVLGVALSIRAQTVPSSSQCMTTYNAIGQNNFLIQLLPCQSGPSQACCDRLQSIAGFKQGASLGGCLCNAELVTTLNQQLSTNALAKSAGVTPALIQKTLESCKIPFVGSGLCPTAAASVTPSPSPSPS
ncbi:hypothetical protein V8C86DRAFT_3128614, partial [Haematococcus lacustris]